MNKKEVAKMIDHTLLKPDATEEMIDKLCQEASTYNFASVCINPYWVAKAAKSLKNSEVKVCTVVGFPLGATSTESKVYETRIAIEQGADEIDMVINIGALKSNLVDIVEEDIKAIVEATKDKAIVKVIIETGILTREEKIKACELSKKAKADFVKTSTGFGYGGATYDDVKLMRSVVGPDMGVKASGGVKTYEDAIKVIEAGATRIGASAGISIVS